MRLHKVHQRTVPPLSLGIRLTVSSPLPPLSSQEEDFIRPSSREEAQQLWEAERAKMRQVLDRQQKQMVEDYQWLRRKEKSLVSSLWPRAGQEAFSAAEDSVITVCWE